MKWFDYFDLWLEDKRSIIDTMIRNMTADLDAGYNYFGNSITKQRQDIEDYKKQLDEQMEKFHEWEPDKIGRWCYFDMKRSGAIL